MKHRARENTDKGRGERNNDSRNVKSRIDEAREGEEFQYIQRSSRGTFLHNLWTKDFPGRVPSTPEFKKLYEWCEENHPKNVLVLGSGLGLIVDVLLGTTFRGSNPAPKGMHLTLIDPEEESIERLRKLLVSHPKIMRQVTLEVATAEQFIHREANAASPSRMYDLVFDDAWAPSGKVWLYLSKVLEPLVKLMSDHGHCAIHCKEAMVPTISAALTKHGFEMVIPRTRTPSNDIDANTLQFFALRNRLGSKLSTQGIKKHTSHTVQDSSMGSPFNDATSLRAWV